MTKWGCACRQSHTTERERENGRTRATETAPACPILSGTWKRLFRLQSNRQCCTGHGLVPRECWPAHIQDWLDSPMIQGIVLAPLCSPFPQPFLSPFLPALDFCQPRAAGCRRRQEQNSISWIFFPFPGTENGGRQQSYKLELTVTSHLLLPNEETRQAADLSLLLKVQPGPVFNISFSANPGTVILI